jgi:hypothetical protein
MLIGGSNGRLERWEGDNPLPDTESPTVTVNVPNGGEEWDVNGTYQIQWTASDNEDVTSDSVFYSSDNGSNWTFIESHTGNPQSCSWTIPDDQSVQCLVKVVVYDDAENSAFDTSNNTFSISELPFQLSESFEGNFLPAGWDTTYVVTPASSGDYIQQRQYIYHPTQWDCVPHTGLHTVRFGSMNTNNSDSWLFTPLVNIQAVDSLLYWIASYSETMFPETYQIWKCSSQNPSGADDMLFQETVSWRPMRRRAIDLSAYASTDIYLAFRYISDFKIYLYLDDVSLSSTFDMTSPDVILTEICDHTTNARDFLEIYNAGSSSVDIDGWIIKERYNANNTDERSITLNSTNQLNTGGTNYLTLDAGEYAVILSDPNEVVGFKSTYSIGDNTAIFAQSSNSVPQIDGDERYQLENGGITRAVVDNFGVWTYVDASSFRVISGNSYERINGPENDGTDPSNWDSQLSSGYTPTPGGENETQLPVVLSSFTAFYVQESEFVTIMWTTQSETNNLGWNIYRSETNEISDAFQINFNIILGAGTTTEPTEYIYEDEHEIGYGETYWYWLESREISGLTETYGPISLLIPEEGDDPESPDLPKIYGLYQNYPNPFNPGTEIGFSVKTTSPCEVSIYDIRGRKIATLFNDIATADEIYHFVWNSEDKQGKQVSSGIYYYRLIAPEKTEIRKMLLLK